MHDPKCSRPAGRCVSLDRLHEKLLQWEAIIAALNIAGATACAETLETARRDVVSLLDFDQLQPF